MTDGDINFESWEECPHFCGPRISPRLRIRRIVDEQNRRDESMRRDELSRWVDAWREACEAAGGNPQPRSFMVVRRARSDAYIDQMYARYGVERCMGLGLRREDQKWLP
jgi:hypothetical protein